MRRPPLRRPLAAVLSASLVATALTAGCVRPRAPAPAASPAPVDALPGLQQATDAARAHPTFDSYFYHGKAELNRYNLQQSRYGQSHRGDAVLIFVTEDFLRTRQVKFEGHGDPRDAVPVLKLNAYRRFYTGVYPYTVMTSIFAPVRPSLQPALKLTFSATEWCGQVFTQLNRRDDGLHAQSRSYFEAEGDRDDTLPHTTLEDELFIHIRRDPASLPVGPLTLLPALLHLRFDHRPLAPVPAQATLDPAREGQRSYHIAYSSGRTVDITFESGHPHRILSWRESQPGQPTTTAQLAQSILLPYWEKHGSDDSVYRRALGLD